MKKTALTALLGLAMLGGSAHAAESAPAGTCWSKDDPGCSKRRAGEAPMDKVHFEKLLGQLRAAKKSEPQMNILVQKELVERRRYLTCRQLAKVLDQFTSTPMKAALLHSTAQRVVDPEDASVVAKKFNGPMAEQARRLIAGELTEQPDDGGDDDDEEE